MKIIKAKDKEIKMVPTTRKVVELTERLKTKNLNELIFRGYNDVDIKLLAEILRAFAEDENEKNAFSSLNVVYDFMDDWKQENKKSYKDLYSEVIEVVNEMGFFKEKMTEKELKAIMNNPIGTIDLNKMLETSTQKLVDKIAEEEFKGYKG